MIFCSEITNTKRYQENPSENQSSRSDLTFCILGLNSNVTSFQEQADTLWHLEGHVKTNDDHSI